MKRLLILLALAGVGTAFACGSDKAPAADEDDDDDDKDDKETSKGDKDAGKDASKAKPDAKAPTPTASKVLVENVGEKCTTDTAEDDCKGDDATCLESIPLFSATFTDGYCSTADCEDDTACGEGGGCPLGAAKKALGGVSAAAAALPGNCFLKCDSAEDCRDDYLCQSAVDAIPMLSQAISFLPTLSTKYCMPAFTVPNIGGGSDSGAPAAGDGGSKDAGVSSDAGKTDAGKVDAGRDR